MKRTLMTAAALCGLTLGLGAAPSAADAAPSLSRLPNVKICPPVTLASCTDEKNAACAATQQVACKALVEAAWKDNPARPAAEVRPMLRPGPSSDIPKDLRKDGRYYPYSPAPKRLIKKGSRAGWAVLSPTLNGSPLASAATAKSGHRSPAWDKDGPLVASCEEYAYEMLYDWGRFVDSAALCDGDGSCVYDVAYMKSTPGIAGRTLVRRDGVALSPQLPLRRGHVDKNVMFSLSPDWVYVNGDKPLTPTAELKEMAADLAKGSKARAIGCPSCKASETYVDEWAFHKTMRQKLAGVSTEEFEEYARRRAEFERLYANWARARHAEEEMIRKKGNKQTLPPMFVTPRFDAALRRPWDFFLDPWERQQVVHDFEETARKGATTLLKGLRRANVQPPTLPGGLLYVAAPATAWGYGFLAPSLPGRAPQLDPTIPPTPNPVNTSCLPGNASGPALARQDVHACLLASFLRDEWQRKQRGQLSCLDPDNLTCDWSPTMFRDRVLGLGEVYLNQQQRLQDECTAITGSGALPKNPKLPLAKVAAHLEAIKLTIADARRALAGYDKEKSTTGVGRRFGASRGDNGQWGDKDLFSSSYAYHYGWSVEPRQLQDGVPCQLQGDTDNGIAMTATVLGHDLSLVDAALTVDANKGGSGRLHLKTHVNVLGEQLFPEKDLNITQLFKEDRELYAAEAPSPRASATFMAGPVPVTIAAWGQLTVGYQIYGEGRFATTCAAGKDPEFALVAGFEPNAAADVRAQVGVGISGLASVGIRGTINLVRVAFPLTTRLEIIFDKLGQESRAPYLKFDAGLAMTLASLAGRIAFYAEVLFLEDEWEIFSWAGVGPHTIELMKLFDVKMPLVGMK